MKYTLAFLSLLTTMAMAHPGHDHASITAPLLHALWYLPMAVALLGAAYLLYKSFFKGK